MTEERQVQGRRRFPSGMTNKEAEARARSRSPRDDNQKDEDEDEYKGKSKSKGKSHTGVSPLRITKTEA